MTRFCWLVVLFAAVGLALACAGCASPNAESDLPWNMSQPWESAPEIPFGTTGGY